MNRAGGVMAALAANAVAISVLLPVTGAVWPRERSWIEFVSAVPVYILFGTPLALVVALVAGLPISIWMERLRRTRAAHFLALGVLLGMLPFLLYFAYVAAYELLHMPPPSATPARGGRQLLDGLSILALGAWCGAWSALAYWWIAVRPHPRSGLDATL